MAFCDTLRAHEPGGAHNSVHISVHLQVDRNKDRVYFLAGFFFSEGYFPAGLFLVRHFFFSEIRSRGFWFVLHKTLRNIIIRGGVKIKKYARGSPLWVRCAHSICVLPAILRAFRPPSAGKMKMHFGTHFFQALPGRHFPAGFIVLPSTLTSTVTSTVTSI